MLFYNEETWYCQLTAHTCIPSTACNTPHQIWEREKLCLITFLNEPHIYCVHQTLAHSSINGSGIVILTFCIRIRQYTTLHYPSIHCCVFSRGEIDQVQVTQNMNMPSIDMHNPLYTCEDLKLATLWESLSSTFIIGIIIQSYLNEA